MAAMALRGLLVGAAALALAAPAQAERLSVLDNGAVRVAVDLDQGGKITWLSRASGENAGNLLLQSVQSYYGGPYVDGLATWHAVNDAAATVQSSNDGRTIYTRAVGETCECAFEQWVTLPGGPAVSVRNRLTNFRSDANTYEATWQELPALYTLPALHHVFTYDGPAPYRGGPLREFPPEDASSFSPSGVSFAASEHWAALVDDDGFGIGLVTPDRVRFNAVGRIGGWPAGYLSAPLRERLDANVVYEYPYTLVVGSVEQIRAYARAHRPDGRPRLLFRRDRQHVFEENATDLGFPISGALRVRVDRADPQVVRMSLRFDARSVPRLYIRGAWHTRQRLAELFWGPETNASYPFSALRRRPFVVVPDGRFHTYRLDLRQSPSYRGVIGALRLDPVAGAEPGGLVDITCISWKPCPVDRRAERALLASANVPLLETFDAPALNEALWLPTYRNPGTTVDVADGSLQLGVAADALLDPRSGLGAGATTRCTLNGDFDVSVDYRLLDWPEANGVNVNLSLDGGFSVFRSNSFGESVGAWFPPFGGSGADTALAGSLRLAREQGVLTASYRRDGEWVGLRSALVGNGPQHVSLSIWVDGARFAHRDVRVAFDNLRFARGRLSCP